MSFLQSIQHFLRKHQMLCIILLATFLLYIRSVASGFVNLDDPLLVTENPAITHLSFGSLRHVFTSFDPELYIPLTLFSYQAETWLFGLASWHFHLINLFLHLGCIALVYSLALRLTQKKMVALVACALFALHPMSSEAVLWISARKDLMAAFFFLLSWRLFLMEDSKKMYIWSLAVFLLALLSKVSAITLPLVLILSLWYLKKPIAQFQWKKLTPFFVLSILFGSIALFGKTSVLADENIGILIVMAIRSVGFYLRLLAMPVGQSAIHLFGFDNPIAIDVMGIFSLLLLLSISILAWIKKNSSRVIAMGWIFFLITLAPTFLHYTRGGEDILLGSERYAYLPSVGMYLILGSIAAWLMTHRALSRLTRGILSITFLILLSLYSILTWHRILAFQSSVTFNADLIRQSPSFALAHFNMGLALEEAKRPHEADGEYREAMRLKPTYADAAIALGLLYHKEGRIDDSLSMLRHATVMQPDYFKGYFNRGVVLQALGRFDEAATEYERAIALFPDFPAAHLNLATVYGKLKRFDEAVEQYRILGTLDPAFRERMQNVESSLLENSN